MRVLVMKVAELVGSLHAELHVAEHAIDEESAEALLLGEGACRARRECEHRAILVEHEDRADARCLALRGG